MCIQVQTLNPLGDGGLQLERMGEFLHACPVTIKAVSELVASVGNQSDTPQIAANHGDSSIVGACPQGIGEVETLIVAGARCAIDPVEDCSRYLYGLIRKRLEQLLQRNPLKLPPINDLERVGQGAECGVHEVARDKEAQDR